MLISTYTVIMCYMGKQEIFFWGSIVVEKLYSSIFSQNLYSFTVTPLTSSWIVWGRKSTYIQRKCSVWNPKWTNSRQKSFRLTVIYSNEISWRRTRRSFSVRTISTTRKSRYTDRIIVKVNGCCVFFFLKIFY